MYEHTSLYEAYTGSIIAAKGRNLNGVNAILERTRFKHEDWARVRFGAGTPWRRCWFIVSPPDEKEIQKARKTMKRQSAYDRSAPVVKGNIKFYESKKTKKAKPIATITNAYSAYAIYPQSIPLIDQSTLVKVEGQVTVHSPFESTTEGMVFVMPETHPAVSGFEIMLRFLVPTFDTFYLYGRPNRLIAATNNIKSIMFAFPKHQRYGYLEALDIVSLMQSPGCQGWSEARWRRELKEATMRRMSAAGSRASSMSSSKPRFRASLPNRQSNMRAAPGQVLAAHPSIQPGFNQSADNIITERPRDEPESPSSHSRAFSDIPAVSAPLQPPPRLRPDSPVSSIYHLAEEGSDRPASGSVDDRSSPEKDDQQPDYSESAAIREDLVSPSPPAPVSNPPAFTHSPGQMPTNRPRPSPDMRKANSRMSNATLGQLAAAGNMSAIRTNSRESMRQQDVSRNNPYSTEARGLGVSDVNWRASSEVIASPQSIETVPEHPASNNASQDTLPGQSMKNRLSLDTSKAIKRKPVPSFIAPEQPNVTSPGTEPSFNDLRHILDENALNRVGSHQPSNSSPTKDSHQEDESVYDDVSVSTLSPDYSSTQESIVSKGSVKSERKPRMGVMKTVGSTAPQRGVIVGDAHYSVDQPQQPNSEIPDVDFGPTMTFLPTGRPTTSETLKGHGHQRDDSDSTERQRIHVPTHSLDPSGSKTAGRDDRRRSMPWQPGMTNGGTNTSGSGTSQPRAAPSPPYSYRRTQSGTPMPQGPASGNWVTYPLPNQQAETPRDSKQQARSRGPNHRMSHNDYSSQLSGREQEHVARMTGSSFFNFSSGPNKHQPQMNPRGLVGQIDAREREKRDMREGMSSHMVQHAIAQRQQHMQYQDPRASMPPMYGTEGYSAYNPYNIPATGHSVDAMNQSYHRADEPRRQTWYGPPQTPPAYFNQFSLYYGNAS